MHFALSIRRWAFLSAGAIVLLSAPALHAAELTWTGTVGDNDVLNPLNWATGEPPATPAAVGDGDTLIFPGGLAPGATVMPTMTQAAFAFTSFTFGSDAPTYTFVNPYEFGLYNPTKENCVNNSSNYQVLSIAPGGWIKWSGILNAAAGDVVVNGRVAVGHDSSTGSRWLGLAGAHDVYFNVDAAFHPAGNVNADGWTSSVTTDMQRRARGRCFMTGLSGRAYLGNIGTTYRGTFHLDSTTNGALRLTHNNSLGTSATDNTGGAVMIYGGTTGNATLELVNNISVSRRLFYLDGRSGDVANDPHILNVSGNNTLYVGGNWYTGTLVPVTTNSDSGSSNATVLNPGNWNIQSDSGKLTIAGGPVYNLAGSNVAITLQLMGAADGEINAPITVNGTNPSLSVVKKGSGTWTLSNSANDFTGSTTVVEGTLSLGTSGSLAASSLVEVKGGATLDVSGLAGGFAVGSGQALKSRGTMLGNLNLTGGGTLQFDLTNSPAGANDRILLTSNGDLSMSGVTAVSVTAVDGSLAVGTYRLIDYSGALSGDASNLALTGAAGVIDTSIPGQVNLIVSHTPVDLTWMGGNNSNAWDQGAAGTVNWTGPGGATRFFDGDLVTFDDAGSNAPPVNVVGTVVPNHVTFANSVGHDYALTGGNINVLTDWVSNGSGDITVANGDLSVVGTLTHSGTGALTFANTGALPATIALDAGTLVLDRPEPNASMASTLSGAGMLVKNGANTLALGGNASAFTGPIMVAAGVLQANPTSALGVGGTEASGLTVLGGATLSLLPTDDVGTEVMTIAGAGVDGRGAIVAAEGGDSSTWIHQLILSADARLAALTAADASATNFFVGGTGGAVQGNDHDLQVFVDAGCQLDLQNVGETGLNNVAVLGVSGSERPFYLGGDSTLGPDTGAVTLTNARLGFYGPNTDPLAPPSTVDFTKPIVVSADGGGLEVYPASKAIGSPILLDGKLQVTTFSVANNTTATVTLNGHVTGSGELEVHLSANATASRRGMVELTADGNDYAGLTTIGGGGGYKSVIADRDRVTLSIGNGGTTGSIGPADVVVSAPGTLQFNRTDAITFANNVTGSGHVKVAAGTVEITGVHAATGTYTVASGATLVLGGPSPRVLSAGGLTLEDNAALSFRLESPGSPNNDRIMLTGTADLSAVSTLTINVTSLAGPALPPGSYLLVSATTLDTQVPGVPPTLVFNGSASQSVSLTIAGNELYLTVGSLLLPPDIEPLGGDGDVDFADLQALLACFSGPKVPFAPGCEMADFDSDGDSDQADFAMWQACFRGAGFQAVIPNCTTVSIP